MLVGEENRVEVIDLGIDQLLAQVGRGIDQNPRRTAVGCLFDQERAAAPAVFRVVWIAGAPAERRPRHAGRRSAAEDRQFERHAAPTPDGTLLKSRKKFSVVCREICSSETPRASASTFATSTT